MKGSFLIYLILFLFHFVQPLKAQELILNNSVSGVCYAGNKTKRIFIPPPQKFLENKESKGGASITVYYTGFTDQAIKAFDYAISILESILPADAKITVKAVWERNEEEGVLANASVTALAGGWGIDAFKPLALYPVALAEKIYGKSLNSDLDGDIIIRVNSGVNWYLETDGKIPVNSRKYDLVTVIIHEMCHGLGFFDSMDTEADIGWYGFSSFPVIYDTFIENIEGRKLTDTLEFKNNSAELYRELTGGKLFFKGPVFEKITNESGARIWAPSVWDDGSSISHLDEEVYSNFNSLMTPYIDMEEVIHDPGIFTSSILGDIGWINTRIIHSPQGDTEDLLSQIQLKVEIRSDTLFNRDKVGLVYSFDGFINSDTIFMASLNADDHFTAAVNVPSYNSELQYYFFAEDIFLRSFHSPSLYQLLKYKTFIGADTVKPVLIHTPAAYYLETTDSIRLSVEATDNTGIDSVYLEYRVNDRQSSYSGFLRDSADTYIIVLSSDNLSLSGGDSLRYRIYAKDSAAVPNVTVNPEAGFYSIGIEGLGAVISGYATDFTDAEADFYKSGFEIIRPIGWQKSGLHTKHPYESPEENDKSLSYIAMLRNPLIFDESGLLFTYSDIALVEPGEEGAPFGSQDFYDYVVLEASKDFGESWFSLFDGYDASFNSTWLKTYNSSITDQNSNASGKESMFVRQSQFLRPSGFLKAGDTILVRFRLFSDPYAWGWGWAIQDLNINPLIDGIEEENIRSLKIYPNPGRGLIRLSDGSATVIGQKPFRYEVFNTSGMLVSGGFAPGGMELTIDITGSPSGIYIILLYLDDGLRTFRYSLIK